MQPNVAMSPLHSVTCPWCKQHWVTRTGPDCAKCGGPLPPPPGPDLQLAPPPAPRVLPDAFRRRLKGRYVGLLIGNVFLWVGVPILIAGIGLVCVMSFFAAIPILIGALFAFLGYMLRREEASKMGSTLDVLARGAATEGRIVGVQHDPTDLYNGQPAWSVSYVFFVNGARYGGAMNSHDAVHGTHQREEPVWVVYNPSDPMQNSLWPPIA